MLITRIVANVDKSSIANDIEHRKVVRPALDGQMVTIAGIPRGSGDGSTVVAICCNADDFPGGSQSETDKYVFIEIKLQVLQAALDAIKNACG